MRTRPILLSKTCPFCGARSLAEAKMNVPANVPMAVFNLDNMALLVRRQTVSQLLALIELLPYKTFACEKCGNDFRLESSSTKDLLGAILTSMQPVVPDRQPARKLLSRPRPRASLDPFPDFAPKKPSEKDWETESLDNLFDYPFDKDI